MSLLPACFDLANIFLLCAAPCTEKGPFRSGSGSAFRAESAPDSRPLTQPTWLLSLLHPPPTLAHHKHCPKVSAEKLEKVGGRQAAGCCSSKALLKMQMGEIPKEWKAPSITPVAAASDAPPCLLRPHPGLKSVVVDEDGAHRLQRAPMRPSLAPHHHQQQRPGGGPDLPGTGPTEKVTLERPSPVCPTPPPLTPAF